MSGPDRPIVYPLFVTPAQRMALISSVAHADRVDEPLFELLLKAKAVQLQWPTIEDPEAQQPEHRPWPVYFGLIEVLATRWPEVYTVPASQLCTWLRERLA